MWSCARVRDCTSSCGCHGRLAPWPFLGPLQSDERRTVGPAATTQHTHTRRTKQPLTHSDTSPTNHNNHRRHGQPRSAAAAPRPTGRRHSDRLSAAGRCAATRVRLCARGGIAARARAQTAPTAAGQRRARETGDRGDISSSLCSPAVHWQRRRPVEWQKRRHRLRCRLPLQGSRRSAPQTCSTRVVDGRDDAAALCRQWHYFRRDSVPVDPLLTDFTRRSVPVPCPPPPL